MDMKLVLLWCYVTIIHKLTSTLDDSLARENIQEYCIYESFNPECSTNDEIIVVDHSLYGRMRIGKCLTTDFYIGCSVDVLHLADKFCSGKQQCSVSIPNKEMGGEVNCLEDSSFLGAVYLEASFVCLKVIKPKLRTCKSGERVHAVKKSSYLSSLISKDTSCGLHNSPWILEADPGQQINITLIDFSWHKNASQNSNGVATRCPNNYGYILDVESDDVITLCGGGMREKHMYLSRSTTVQVVLDSLALDSHNFLLQYTAVGCPTYKPPEYSWMERKNNSLIIGCYANENSWTLVCIDNIWLGIVGNCTPPQAESVTKETEEGLVIQGAKEESSIQLPEVQKNHVITFVLGCVTLIVCCTVVILGIYCTKRYEVKSMKVPVANFSSLQTVKDGNRTLLYRTVNSTTLRNHDNPPTYTAALPKNERPPPLPQRRPSSYVPNKDRNSDYLTPSSGDVGGEESVHYYILDNLTDGGEGEKMYQNIHLQ